MHFPRADLPSLFSDDDDSLFGGDDDEADLSLSSLTLPEAPTQSSGPPSENNTHDSPQAVRFSTSGGLILRSMPLTLPQGSVQTPAPPPEQNLQKAGFSVVGGLTLPSKPLTLPQVLAEDEVPPPRQGAEKVGLSVVGCLTLPDMSLTQPQISTESQSTQQPTTYSQPIPALTQAPHQPRGGTNIQHQTGTAAGWFDMNTYTGPSGAFIRASEIEGFCYGSNATWRNYAVPRHVDGFLDARDLLSLIGFQNKEPDKNLYSRLGWYQYFGKEVKSEILSYLETSPEFSHILRDRRATFETFETKKRYLEFARHFLDHNGWATHALGDDGNVSQKFSWPQDSTLIVIHFTTLVAKAVKYFQERARRKEKTPPRLATQDTSVGPTVGDAQCTVIDLTED